MKSGWSPHAGELAEDLAAALGLGVQQREILGNADRNAWRRATAPW